MSNELWLYEWQHLFGIIKIDGVDTAVFEEKLVNVSYVEILTRSKLPERA